MKRFDTIVLAGLLFLAGELAAQSRVEKPNEVNLELGGKSGFYSLCYQRMIGSWTGLEFGLSYIELPHAGEFTPFFSARGGVRLYTTKKSAAFCVSTGIVFVSAAAGINLLQIKRSTAYFYVSPGFEYRARTGFVLRASVNFLSGPAIGDLFFIWPGLALGIAF